MNSIEWNDLLDRYVKGTLTHDERAMLHTRMSEDAELRRQVEQHSEMYHALKLVHNRESVRKKLADFENELQPMSVKDTRKPPVIKKYWPTIAVAASVALISIVGTVLMTQSLQTQQSAMYKELRRIVPQVEKIAKSQNILMADIAKNSPSPAVPPAAGSYAGSGFLISNNGYLVTSYHVVKGADSVFIQNNFYGRLKAAVVATDPDSDVAILRMEGDIKINRLPYTISGTEANLGEEVYTLGFPREDVVFGEGSISALSGYQQNPNAYQISVPVNPGNSGGPLFNSRGDLVGIISGIQTETSSAAFAIKSSVLLSVLANTASDSTHAPLVLPRQNIIRNMSKVEQIKRWKDNVFIVTVFDNKKE